MKKLLLTLVLTLFAANAYALEQCKSGAYYNPETDGTGIDLQVGKDLIVVFRYGYSSNGADYWVGATDNDDSGVYVFDMSQTYASNGSVEQDYVGSLILTELEDGRLNMEWDWQLDLSNLSNSGGIPWCIGCFGEEELSPLFLPHDCE